MQPTAANGWMPLWITSSGIDHLLATRRLGTKQSKSLTDSRVFNDAQRPFLREVSELGIVGCAYLCGKAG